MKHATLPVLINSLLRPEFYAHPVTGLELIETHISWVILTGEFAYKLKKPVDLGFLDFSTLEKRRLACEEELRLNARFAPELYLEVIPVTGTPAAPRFGGAGPAIEFAVKMHEFAQAQQLDRLLSAGTGDQAELASAFRSFGERLARFHRDLPPAGKQTVFGIPDAVCDAAMKNFEQLEPLNTNTDCAPRLATLHQWTRDRCDNLAGAIASRKADGHVRECHGDLHLRNLVLLDNGILPFDCIEFSAELRWIDVVSDVAFLFMDLLFHEREVLAYTFLNAWLNTSGDYAGLRLLRFYAAYRAMVRAKIAGIELVQEGWPSVPNAPELDAHLADLKKHLRLAEHLSQGGQPLLIITHGVSGSGKTWLATRLACELGAVHARSDVERKRLFGLAPEARSAEDLKTEIYGRQASVKTYARLLEIAQTCLGAGEAVIIDATFLRESDRESFERLARRDCVPFVIMDCQAAPRTLRERVRKRHLRGSDASEADIAVLDLQLAQQEALSDNEQRYAITVQSDRPDALESLVSGIKAARK